MYSIVLMLGLTTPAAPPPAQLSPAPAPTVTAYVQASSGCNGSAAAYSVPAPMIRSAGCNGSAAFSVRTVPVVTTRTVTVREVQETAESCSGGEAMGLRQRFRERRRIFPIFRPRGCSG